mmetsp:Transcript_542/g.1372  ORF Transcript_542/g.1372 Transcript_542/m.1372 type:complete len:268 (-) Transcript_542:450-1253(-)
MLANLLGEASETTEGSTIEEAHALHAALDALLNLLVKLINVTVESGLLGLSSVTLSSKGKVEAPVAAEGRHVNSVRDDDIEGRSQGAVDDSEALLLSVVDGSGTRLSHEDTTGVKLGLNKVVELVGVQLVARASLDRVADIHDNNVKGLVSVLKPLLSVLVKDFEAGILVSTTVPLGELLAADITGNLININHDTAFDTLVAQDLAGGGELTTTTDEDLLGVLVQEHGRVHEGLVVDVLVSLSALRLAIHNKGASELVGANDLNTLE